MNLIKRLWNGEIPLVKTYWIYGVIFSNIAALILFSLMTASIESNFFIGYEIARILTLLILSISSTSELLIPRCLFKKLISAGHI